MKRRNGLICAVMFALAGIPAGTALADGAYNVHINLDRQVGPWSYQNLYEGVGSSSRETPFRAEVRFSPQYSDGTFEYQVNFEVVVEADPHHNAPLAHVTRRVFVRGEERGERASTLVANLRPGVQQIFKFSDKFAGQNRSFRITLHDAWPVEGGMKNAKAFSVDLD